MDGSLPGVLAAVMASGIFNFLNMANFELHVFLALVINFFYSLFLSTCALYSLSLSLSLSPLHRPWSSPVG